MLEPLKGGEGGALSSMNLLCAVVKPDDTRVPFRTTSKSFFNAGRFNKFLALACILSVHLSKKNGLKPSSTFHEGKIF